MLELFHVVIFYMSIYFIELYYVFPKGAYTLKRRYFKNAFFHSQPFCTEVAIGSFVSVTVQGTVIGVILFLSEVWPFLGLTLCHITYYQKGLRRMIRGIPAPYLRRNHH